MGSIVPSTLLSLFISVPVFVPAPAPAPAPIPVGVPVSLLVPVYAPVPVSVLGTNSSLPSLGPGSSLGITSSDRRRLEPKAAGYLKETPPRNENNIAILSALPFS